jgi:hypothetical protein
LAKAVQNLPHKHKALSSNPRNTKKEEGGGGRGKEGEEERPSERKSGHWGHALEGDIGTLAPSCLSFCFLASRKLPTHEILGDTLKSYLNYSMY